MVATSALGLFYYLRLILVMFARLPQEPVGPEEVEADRGILGPAHPEAEVACVLPVAPPPLPLAGQVALGGLAVVLVFLGIFPAPLIAIIQRLAAVLYCRSRSRPVIITTVPTWNTQYARSLP